GRSPPADGSRRRARTGSRSGAHCEQRSEGDARASDARGGNARNSVSARRGGRGEARGSLGAGMTVPLKTRILLADDHTVVRGGLRMVLDAEPDLEVVAEASDGREAVDAAVENEVDLAV